MTSMTDIQRWAKYGIEEGHNYMAIICDTFDYDDFPTFFDSKEAMNTFLDNMNSMHKLMETYDLNKDIGSQLRNERNFV